MSETYWIRPPKSENTGGFIKTRKGTTEIVRDVNQTTSFGFVGYECKVENNYHPCYVFHMFIKFPITTLHGGTVSDVGLHLFHQTLRPYLSTGGAISGPAGSHNDDCDINVYARSTYSGDYPWAVLDEYDDDLGSNWTNCGVCDININTLAVDTENKWIYFNSTPFKSALQNAIDEEWEWFGVRFRSEYDEPNSWDYSTLVSPEQWLWATIQGGTSVINCGAEPYHYPMPPDYSPDSTCVANPWLEVEWDTGDPQEEPGEPEPPTPSIVNVVDADPKAIAALAGTASGNLWFTWNDGLNWAKLHTFSSAITAIYMDYIKNLNDFPDYAISWVGLANGQVWQSSTSMRNYMLKTTSINNDSITEIRGNQNSSNMVLFAAGKSLYSRGETGSSWYRHDFTSNITGIWSSTTNVQIVFADGTMSYSTNWGYGTNWANGTPNDYADPGIDITYNVRDITQSKEKSIIVSDTHLYNVKSVNDFTLTYKEAASITGTGQCAEADFESDSAFIGTSSNCYRTYDWGESVSLFKSIPTTDIAIGGVRNINGIVLLKINCVNSTVQVGIQSSQSHCPNPPYYGLFPVGTVVYIVAWPNGGYSFSQWSPNSGSVPADCWAESTTVTVNENTEITCTCT